MIQIVWAPRAERSIFFITPPRSPFALHFFTMLVKSLAARLGRPLTSAAVRSAPAYRMLHVSAPVARRGGFLPVNPTPSVEEAVTNILHNTPQPQPTHNGGRHILSCLAHNEPGVISRVSGILQSRGFNIESLVAAHTELPGLSRMTVVLNGEGRQIEQAKRQLEDVVRIKKKELEKDKDTDVGYTGTHVGCFGLQQHEAR